MFSYRAILACYYIPSDGVLDAKAMLFSGQNQMLAVSIQNATSTRCECLRKIHTQCKYNLFDRHQKVVL